MSGSSYAYASGRVSGLEETLLSNRSWHQLLAAADRADVIRILGETWYGSLLQGDTDPEEALLTAVSRAEDELRELSLDRSFTDGILQRRDVRNARYLWKDLASGGEGLVRTEAPGTIPTDRLRDSWTDPGEAEALPAPFRECLEKLKDLSKPDAARLDAELDRLAALVESSNLGSLPGPLSGLSLVKIELRNFLTAARCRGEGFTSATLEEILLEGGSHSPSEVADAARARKLSSTLAEGSGFEDAASALETGLESGSFLEYQKVSDGMIMEILAKASADMFGPGPLASYVLNRELEVSHLKQVIAGKTAGIDPSRLKARVPRG